MKKYDENIDNEYWRKKSGLETKYMEEYINILNEEKYNVPISDEKYSEMSKFSSDIEIDIGKVKFRESTAINLCDKYDIENFMKDK